MSEGKDVKIFLRPGAFTASRDGKGQVTGFLIKGFNRDGYRDGVVSVPVYGVKGIRAGYIKNSQKFKDWLFIGASPDVMFSVKEDIVEDGFEFHNGGKIRPDQLYRFANIRNREIVHENVIGLQEERK